MKRIDFYYFLTLGILAVFFFGIPKAPHFKQAHKMAITAEQRTSHLIIFLDNKGEELGRCTGTAIGPNAVLTAEHCNERGESKQVTFDLVKEKHNILASTSDDRDHIIYLVDGSSFSNIEPVVSKLPTLNEVVTSYGNIYGTYPATPRYGRVTDCDDPSDLDAAAGEECYSLEVNRGDSGSAVFNTKGEIVGLVTYMHEDEQGKTSGIGFSLNFNTAQLKTARMFVPSMLSN
jgi:hypothetical protein